MTNEFTGTENHENDILGVKAHTVTFSAKEQKLKIKEVKPAKVQQQAKE